MESSTLLNREKGCDIRVLSADAAYPLTKSGVEAALRKVISIWPKRAEGHEHEPKALVAFKFVIAFDPVTNSVSGAVPVPKSWRTLKHGFTGSSKEAFMLPAWTLILPPLAPRVISTVVVPGRVHNELVDPVIEHYCPEHAFKTFARTTFHFLCEEDAIHFLDFALKDVEDE